MNREQDFPSADCENRELELYMEMKLIPWNIEWHDRTKCCGRR